MAEYIKTLKTLYDVQDNLQVLYLDTEWGSIEERLRKQLLFVVEYLIEKEESENNKDDN